MATIEHGTPGVLDPELAAFLNQMMEQGPPPPFDTLTPTQAREIFNPVFRELGGSPEPVAHVEDLKIPGPGGEIPVRIYTPEGSGPFPVLVYFHGSGWVFLDLDAFDSVCCSLANGANCVVASVDYRLAPENKFPAAIEDAYAATQWAADNAQRINGDPGRVSVGGDSAGGTLAAGVSLMARDKGEPSLVYQLLIYPPTNLSSRDTDSYRQYGEDYLITERAMEWFINHYLRSEEDGRNPYASPLLANDLSGLPPAFVLTAESDVLADDGKEYANRLEQAGVPVTHTHYNGLIHGFWSITGLEQTRNARKEAASALLSAFAK